MYELNKMSDKEIQELDNKIDIAIMKQKMVINVGFYLMQSSGFKK